MRFSEHSRPITPLVASSPLLATTANLRPKQKHRSFRRRENGKLDSGAKGVIMLLLPPPPTKLISSRDTSAAARTSTRRLALMRSPPPRSREKLHPKVTTFLCRAVVSHTGICKCRKRVSLNLGRKLGASDFCCYLHSSVGRF